MEDKNVRFLVIGAGVNGSICAVGLHQAGFEVVVLARGKRYEELLNEGIIIEDPFKKTRSVTRVPVIHELKPDDSYDYVLVIIRKNQLPELLPVLARNSSPNVVFMINNPSGPQMLVDALGRQRVLLGFVFGAGRREGNLIHGFSLKATRKNATPFGELDGAITPRLIRLVEIFNQAGLGARLSSEMTDYLARHAAFVAPFAHLLILHHCDNYACARATADLALLVEALRETFLVLETLGVKTAHDRMTGLLRHAPKFMLVPALRILLATRYAEVGGAWHCMQAPDEMEILGIELMALVEKSGRPAPALHRLFSLRSGSGPKVEQ